MTTILTALGCFFLGVFFAPAVKPLLRPFFLEIVKVIVSLLNEIKFASAKMKEEMDDAVAAANAERQAKKLQEATEALKKETESRSPTEPT
jgi:hypothetical protein